jgi:hypothetical protein
MVDPTVGNELIECRQVPLINDLLKEPLNKSLVVVCYHWVSSFLWSRAPGNPA